MKSLTYIDFDLLIQRSESVYQARVLSSPAGQASRVFAISLSELEIENFLLRLGRPRRGTRRVDSPEVEAAKDFGGRLFECLFDDEVLLCLHSSIDEAYRSGVGLRMRLRLNDVPELAELPWEFLYNRSRNRFLGLSVETPLVRYLDLPESIRPLSVKPPLRMLVALSDPDGLPRLDTEDEWSKLKSALSELESRGLVVLDRLAECSLVGLRRHLRKKECHIFHFVGHGTFDSHIQDGALVFEDVRRRGIMVSGQELGTVLHDHRPLRLAVLNACEGARPSRNDPFGGVAQTLVQQAVPAVVAMQFEITDDAAITFAQEFYGAIADGYPVDAAVCEGRQAIYISGNRLEWGTPVLYMRSHDGRVFQISREEPSVEQLPRLSPRGEIAGLPEEPRKPPHDNGLFPRSLGQALLHAIWRLPSWLRWLLLTCAGLIVLMVVLFSVLPDEMRSALLGSVVPSRPAMGFKEQDSPPAEVIPSFEDREGGVSEPGAVEEAARDRSAVPSPLHIGDGFVWDSSSGLAWVRDLYVLGNTTDLFRNSDQGRVTPTQDLAAIEAAASELTVGKLAGWHVASGKELGTLTSIDGSALFQAFGVRAPTQINIAGVFVQSDGSVSAWGYQYANYLVGPYDIWWFQQNELGVWITTRPPSRPALTDLFGAIEGLPETRIEVPFGPLMIGQMVQDGNQITAAWKDVDFGFVGKLGGERRSVFYYNIKELGRGAFFRGELTLDPIQSSGLGVVSVSVFETDGYFKPDLDWEPKPINEKNSQNVTWDGRVSTRVTLPEQHMRNLFGAGQWVGVHCSYEGDGDVRFKPPKLIITYIRESDLLINRQR